MKQDLEEISPIYSEFIYSCNGITLPVDLIPRIMQSQQRTQTENKLRLTVQFIAPPSSMELEMSNVVRYQK